MQNANRQSRVHTATMVRNLFLLLVIGAAFWFGPRALLLRGEVKATIVFDHAVGLHAGDPVVADGTTIGVVTKITGLDDSDAASVPIDPEHRRAIVTDSAFAIGKHRVIVTNTLTVGSPVADMA